MAGCAGSARPPTVSVPSTAPGVERAGSCSVATPLESAVAPTVTPGDDQLTCAPAAPRPAAARSTVTLTTVAPSALGRASLSVIHCGSVTVTTERARTAFID